MRVIPGFCRDAAEAACEARVRKQLIEDGVPHADVEHPLDELTTLNTRLAAAFGLDTAQGREIAARLRAIDGEDAVRSVKAMRTGAHKLVRVDPLQ